MCSVVSIPRGQFCEENLSHVKYDVAFVSSGSEQRHIFVADVLYAISRYIVPPYIGGQLSLSTKCYQNQHYGHFQTNFFHGRCLGTTRSKNYGIIPWYHGVCPCIMVCAQV